LPQKFRGDPAGAIEIEREISPEKACGLEAAEEEIRVGDGGVHAASVADGAGIGSSGFGPYTQDTCDVEAGDRASAGADRVDVEHGDAHR
jgi:hypothetical protein